MRWGGRETTKEFMAAMPAVYDKVLACCALGLGLPEDFFVEVRRPHTVFRICASGADFRRAQSKH